MLRKSVINSPPTHLMPNEKRKCLCITNFIMSQCVFVCILGLTVVHCWWKPSLADFDPYKLASVMYLYDEKECEYVTTMKSKYILNLRLSNDTKGFNVLPIQWTPAIVTVSTRLSNKTRTYIEMSMVIHLIWLLLSIIFRIIVSKNTTINAKLLRFALKIYLHSLLFVIIFDLSMAIVYITHIKQALTKGMIVRYSGWSVELKLKNYDDFAGYLPLIAAACWMRGIVILAVNIYSCKVINKIHNKRMQRDILTAFLCIIISWLTLSCRLSPDESELAEVTLIKLLYIYEPEACGRIYFYNYTTLNAFDGGGTTVVWLVKNSIAVGFRSKLKIWLVLHIFWTILALVNISQGAKPCSYYVSLLPFTLTGIALLVVDVVFCVLFILDVNYTRSEAEILDYINTDGYSLYSINATLQRPTNSADTTWIATTLAFCSVRGIVQWIVNFWIVKDSYFNGLAVYHRLQQMSHRRRSQAKNVQMYRIPV